MIMVKAEVMYAVNISKDDIGGGASLCACQLQIARSPIVGTSEIGWVEVRVQPMLPCG